MRGDDELGGDVVALGVGDHRGALDGALVGAGVGALGGRGQAGDGVLDAVELEDVGLEAGRRLLLAAVGGGAGLGLHLDRVLLSAVGDGELARLVGDVVVLKVGALERVRGRDGALAGADQGLGAGVGAALDALALGEGACGHLELGRGERGAVVGLLGVDGPERHVALGDLDIGSSLKSCGLTRNGYINLNLNRVSACIFALRRDIAPRFTVIGAVLNSTLLDEVLSLLLILLIKVASLIDGDIDRRKAMLFAVIGVFVASYSKARPQGIKGVGLVSAVNIGNGVASFPDGGRLASALFVKPTNERFTRGGWLSIGHLNGVVLGKAVVVVPLQIFSANSVSRSIPRRT